jgi:hypothetical protein
MLIDDYKRDTQYKLSQLMYNCEYHNCIRKHKNKINAIIKEKIQKYESVPYIIDDKCFELRSILKNFINKHILGKKNNIPRDKITYNWFIKNNFEIYYNYIFYSTYYLYAVPIQERIYHIINDVRTKQLCENPKCSSFINFLDFSRGYRRFCSVSCSKNEDELKKLGIIKEFNSWTDEKKEYYSLVRRYTNKALKENDINPNDLPIGINGSGDVYQVDHIIPIIYGFNNKINPEIIGSFENLQLIHWYENNQKSKQLNQSSTTIQRWSTLK